MQSIHHEWKNHTRRSCWSSWACMEIMHENSHRLRIGAPVLHPVGYENIKPLGTFCIEFQPACSRYLLYTDQLRTENFRSPLFADWNIFGRRYMVDQTYLHLDLQHVYIAMPFIDWAQELAQYRWLYAGYVCCDCCAGTAHMISQVHRHNIRACTAVQAQCWMIHAYLHGRQKMWQEKLKFSSKKFLTRKHFIL